MNKVLITSQGRTATTSINKALQSLPKVTSFHERQRTDVSFLFYSQLAEFQQLTQDYLKKENEFANASSGDHFVAVNPYFRFAGAQLSEAFGWKVAHLIRHPKTYLESVFPRRIFTQYDTGLHQLPKANDPFQSKWQEASRFEKLCWYYAHTLKYFKTSDFTCYKYEDIVHSEAAMNKMMDDLDLPKFDRGFKLGKFNSKQSLRNRLVAIKNQRFSSTPLAWKKLSTNDMQTYHELFDPLVKHFEYDL
jgi:hypothetical protein